MSDLLSILATRLIKQCYLLRQDRKPGKDSTCPGAKPGASLFLRKNPMLLSAAKPFVGQIVTLTYRERSGELIEKTAEIYDIGFVPLFGPCLITDVGEIRLDRVETCWPVTIEKTA